ncbi:uncharacterized protein F5147DRAFT_81404 [Suillus discolor]|uniref:Uncharacterized protein n=1 Tax=Suillus discolor TaxID=1912936 RepID=A0A9P7JWV2_9AGAM|nr:uncharacterized protein F5147DRAFT_81404 [Suillus discolor]KAG2112387.1 hypothetical protein F5147DRAFT_81404 [Suillus discolor]
MPVQVFLMLVARISHPSGIRVWSINHLLLLLRSRSTVTEPACFSDDGASSNMGPGSFHFKIGQLAFDQMALFRIDTAMQYLFTRPLYSTDKPVVAC